MVLLGEPEDASAVYLKTTDLLPMLEAGVELMLNECMANPKTDPRLWLANWLKEHNPRRDPEMAVKVGAMRSALEAEARAAAEMYEGAIKVQASVRGRQSRLRAKGMEAEAKALEAEAEAAAAAVAAAKEMQASGEGGTGDDAPTDAAVAAADDAAASAIRVQAAVRGRQARAKVTGMNTAAEARAEQELEAEAKAADEAVQAAIKVQAGIRGRQVRAKAKPPEPAA